MKKIREEWVRRHPLSKLAAFTAATAFFLFLPDRDAAVICTKLAIIAGLVLLPPRFSWRRWLKIILPWASFTLLIGLAALLSAVFSGEIPPFSSPGLRGFLSLAARSFWLVNLAFSAVLSFAYPELVWLARRLTFSRGAASQILLVVMTWEKLLAEFGRVPLAWKSRGIKARRRPMLAARRVFQAAILRSLDKAFHLETALLSRGFQGGFYTLWDGRWRPADSFFLSAALIFFGLLGGCWSWI